MAYTSEDELIKLGYARNLHTHIAYRTETEEGNILSWRGGFAKNGRLVNAELAGGFVKHFAKSDMDKSADLLRACETGDLEKVVKLIDEEVCPEYKWYLRRSMLEVAANNGHLEVIKFITTWLKIDKDYCIDGNDYALPRDFKRLTVEEFDNLPISDVKEYVSVHNNICNNFFLIYSTICAAAEHEHHNIVNFLASFADATAKPYVHDKALKFAELMDKQIAIKFLNALSVES